MRRWRKPWVLLALVGAAAALTAPAGAQDLAVEAVNASVPTLCAETDNVSVNFSSAAVRRFRVAAVHPAYVGTIVADRASPDFRNCDMSGDPAHRAEPRRVTLYEDETWQLVGHVFPQFWRPATVPVHVGERTTEGLHLLQLWTRFQERAEEVLVLYPADGYWRARPLPPAHLRWSAYGSSFLIGPVETSGRPVVNLREVAFDPQTRSFRLSFSRGGNATVRLAVLDQERIALDVSLAGLPGSLPFAALRSMYVTDTNADVAQVAWRTAQGKAWQQAPIMIFDRSAAVEFWAGRAVPSRHNLSAPDMIFGPFGADESGARP
ncbi:MAG TPA: hypothetical protein VFQ27_03470 [Xanthobacteraceae bacterium]|nr:hypothetical protein [Xanthobacteraceae bacterium]